MHVSFLYCGNFRITEASVLLPVVRQSEVSKCTLTLISVALASLVMISGTAYHPMKSDPLSPRQHPSFPPPFAGYASLVHVLLFIRYPSASASSYVHHVQMWSLAFGCHIPKTQRTGDLCPAVMLDTSCHCHEFLVSAQ